MFYEKKQKQKVDKNTLYMYHSPKNKTGQYKNTTKICEGFQMLKTQEIVTIIYHKIPLKLDKQTNMLTLILCISKLNMIYHGLNSGQWHFLS